MLNVLTPTFIYRNNQWALMASNCNQESEVVKTLHDSLRVVFIARKEAFYLDVPFYTLC